MLGELTREHESNGHLHVPGSQHFRETMRFVLISFTVIYFPESFVRRFSLFFTLCLKRRQVDAGPDTIPLIPRKIFGFISSSLSRDSVPRRGVIVRITCAKRNKQASTKSTMTCIADACSRMSG